jgi:hypothetical protein
VTRSASAAALLAVALTLAGTIAQPLLSSTRRPDHEVSPETLPREPTSPWRLAGVLESQAERRTIFAKPRVTSRLAVGEGERVGAFVIGAITVGEVTMLEPDGGRRVVRPAPDPTAQAATTVTSTEPASAALPARPAILNLLHSIPSGSAAASGPPDVSRDDTHSRAAPLGAAW